MRNARNRPPKTQCCRLYAPTTPAWTRLPPNIFAELIYSRAFAARTLRLRAVGPFLVPGGLNRFQFSLVGLSGVAGKSGQFGDPLMHVGETHGIGINVRKFVGQRNGDVFKIIPIKRCGHSGSLMEFVVVSIVFQTIQYDSRCPSFRACLRRQARRGISLLDDALVSSEFSPWLMI